MQLYDYWRSSASYRVRIALALKGVAYDLVPVSLLAGDQRSEAHLARNPQGLVPALETDDGRVLTQSLAIVDWLDARFPEPRLIPADPDDRAEAMAQALTIGCDIHPLNNLRVLKRLKNDYGLSDDARDEWACHWIAEGFEALERRVATSACAFLGGETPGVADLFLVPQVYNARRVALDMAPYPTLARVDAALTALPAFHAAHPDQAKPQDA